MTKPERQTMNLDSFKEYFSYSDWANTRLCEVAGNLSNEALDQPFDIGLGSLRRTLTHIWAGEHVWTLRWQGRSETPWPIETAPVAPATLLQRYAEVRARRDAFVAELSPEKLRDEVVYRDSKGSLFHATLNEMILQLMVHSIHHRAQAANLIRRLGGTVDDMDYMYHVRLPA